MKTVKTKKPTGSIKSDLSEKHPLRFQPPTKETASSPRGVRPPAGGTHTKRHVSPTKG